MNIKLFEGIDEKYYEEIGGSEFFKKIGEWDNYEDDDDIENFENKKNLELFTNYEIKIITDMGYEVCKNTVEFILSRDDRTDNINISRKNDIDDQMIIYKMKDEWFYIEIWVPRRTAKDNNPHMEYYKVDQLHGLVEFLNDKYPLDTNEYATYLSRHYQDGQVDNFENLNQDYYYKKINSNEWVNYIQKESLYFSNSEFDIINNSGFKIDLKYTSIYGKKTFSWQKTPNDESKINAIKYIREDLKLVLEIKKIVDEYYLIKYSYINFPTLLFTNHIYYICDQFDGLMEFIKDADKMNIVDKKLSLVIYDVTQNTDKII